ncbi:unnamed protein product [Haemonchus placei]|uniref:CHK domain-containing protein n=1 Tax=Haemonchus placei TaxID=6290 RepID=A0A158QLK1_HAEPC|nr:unnamed protein product [Haemonchus placei]
MENGMVMTIDEKARVDALIRKCFPDVEDFEHSVSYSLAFLSNKKSFWSKIARVFLHWKDDKLSAKYPRSVFIKIPHISDNVKGTDKSENYSDESDAAALLKLTQYEVLWYERYGNDSIPHFPFPKFYAAETVIEPGTGIIAMEDLSERVKAMDSIPGFSYEQVERLMDALAGFHYHFISKKDQSWVTEFNRVAEIEPEFQDLQLVAIIDFQLLHTGNFAEDIVRVLIISLSRHDRCSMTERFLKRYHDTLTRLSNGKPPFTLNKVYEAYDRIFLYACNFALFGLSIYHDMCEDLEKDEVRRVKFQNELIDRAYGVVIDAERLLFSQST